MWVRASSEGIDGNSCHPSLLERVQHKLLLFSVDHHMAYCFRVFQSVHVGNCETETIVSMLFLAAAVAREFQLPQAASQPGP